MADDELQLTVKINADTGQLEVVGQKMAGVGKAAQGLTSELGGLAKGFLPFTSAAAITAFFVAAVKGAEEENQALNRLKFALAGSTQNWDSDRAAIVAWSTAIQKATRFSDGEALKSLDQLVRATGNLKQAQSASTIAQNLAVVSGKNLSETTQLVNDLVTGQARAVLMANKEFGQYAGSATSAQQALDNLARSTQNAAVNEEGQTTSVMKAKNALGEMADTVGNTLSPAVIFLADLVKGLTQVFEGFATQVAGAVKIAATGITGLWEAIKAAGTGNLAEARAAMQTTLQGMVTDHILTQQAIQEVFAQGEVNRDIQEERVRAKKKAKSEEDLAAEREQELKRQSQLEQLEMELDLKLEQLHEKGLLDKQRNIDREIQMEFAKSKRLIKTKDEEEKIKAQLEKIGNAKKAALMQEDMFTRQQMAVNVIQTAIQTLQVMNSLGESGSKSERVRAKALLALQQAVTIGWIWVSAAKEASMNPGMTGMISSLAAAQTGLAVANFAAQSRAIDKAASTEASGIGGITLEPTAPGITLGEGGSNGGSTFGGSSLGGGGGSGGGGGGGGPSMVFNINISANFDIASLSRSDAPLVMRQIYDELRKGTTDSIQLAVLSKKVADKNSGLAVG